MISSFSGVRPVIDTGKADPSKESREHAIWRENGLYTITGGKLMPFKCPIVGQDGKEVECKGGTHLDDGQVLGMNFYVKGIDEKMPGK